MPKRKRKKPTYKYPCLECKEPVKITQRGVQCNTCKKWVHLNCTDLNQSQCDFLEASNDDFLFFCLECKPRQFYSEEIFETTSDCPNDDRPNSPHSDLSESEYSDAHSSDFTYEYDDGSDSDCRGLDFDSLPLPIQNTCLTEKNYPTKSLDIHKQLSVRTVNDKLTTKMLKIKHFSALLT